jgi:hypothetical protein
MSVPGNSLISLQLPRPFLMTVFVRMQWLKKCKADAKLAGGVLEEVIDRLID